MTIPVPAFTYLGCHLIMDNQRKCQLDYYCEKTRHYNLLYDPFYTLASSRNYALCSQIYLPFSLHKNYNGSMYLQVMITIIFLFIVLLCLMLYCCFLTFIAT